MDSPTHDYATCGGCGLTWDDAKATSMTPAPSARCPFEAFHEYDRNDNPLPLRPSDIPADFPVQHLVQCVDAPPGVPCTHIIPAERITICVTP